MQCDQIVFVGPPIDDESILCQIPISLQLLLLQVNGFTRFRGGLHIRGACKLPSWHSLAWSWHSSEAFHHHYDGISKEDVPFGQTCVGDQFFARRDTVIKLFTETGYAIDLKMSVMEFFDAVEADPETYLNLSLLDSFQREGGTLIPGELINVYPPFCVEESADGVALAAVPIRERLTFLAELSKLYASLPDGAVIEFDP